MMHSLIINKKKGQLPYLSYKKYTSFRSLRSDEVLLSICYVGLCGSDFHTFECDEFGNPKFSGKVRYPHIIGHEFSGRVEAVGTGVTKITVGEFVTAESVLYCGKCVSCKERRFGDCTDAELLGLSVDGAVQTKMIISAKYLHSLSGITSILPLKTALKVATLIEPLGCSFRAFIRIEESINFSCGSFGIFGAGPIGLGAAWILENIFGVKKIALFDICKERIECAQKVLRNTKMFQLNEHYICSSHALPELLFDTIIESSGAGESVLNAAIHSIKNNGTIIYLSRMNSASIKIDINTVVTKGIKIIGSRGHHEAFPRLIKYFENNYNDSIESFISEIVPFTNIKDYIEKKHYLGKEKIVIEMPFVHSLWHQ